MAGEPGSVYLGTEQSEICCVKLGDAPRTTQIVNVAPLSYIKSVDQFEGRLWVCADNGIGVVRSGVVEKLENLPMNNSVDHMMADYQGNLWFASSRQGVMKVVTSNFQDVTALASLPEEVVNSTCLAEGLLYIGTDNGRQVVTETSENLPWLAKTMLTIQLPPSPAIVLSR